MKVYLPSTEGKDRAWVILDLSKLPMADYLSPSIPLAQVIVEWSFEEPITDDNISVLPENDVKYIRRQIDSNVIDKNALKKITLALSAHEREQDLDVKVPMDFVYFQYRKIMGISYAQFLETPVTRVKQDLEYLIIEKSFNQ